MRFYASIYAVRIRLLTSNSNTQRGISFAVYDKVDPATRTRDWSMTIFWSFRHYPSLLSEELNNRINEAQSKVYYNPTAVEELVVKNAETGDVLARVNSPFARRVNRVGMRKLLLNGVKVQVYFIFLRFHLAYCENIQN